MQSHSLEITADNQATALERLLQVTRYRGFTITDLVVSTSESEQTLAIKMSVYQPNSDPLLDQNSIERLYHQLNKLFDIKHVNLVPAKGIEQQLSTGVH